MRIGLVRHFPVQEAWPNGWVTSADLQQWRVRYDASELIVGPIDISAVAWQRYFSSDLKRAYVTAQAAYSGTIIQTPLLREVETLPFATGRLRLPLWGWRWVYRLAWLTGHKSQRPARDDLHRRVRAMADLLEAESVDTLVVSHAGMMHYLRKELLRRGFRGPSFKLAEHARLYSLRTTLMVTAREPPCAEQLARKSIPLLPPAEITDETLTPILRELLHNLSLQGFYVLHTDHFSDRELYAELWERGLRDPCHLPGRNPRGGWFHDFLGSWGEAEMQLWLRYYVTDDERAKHAREYPKDKIPPKEKPISNRDWRLPKGPF